jgi:tetratricopeptide (TPR) repeat protein
MNTRALVLITILLAVFINGCEKRETLGKQQLTQIITARTLGLGYLEENRLKEAETEFRKVIEIAPKEALGYANLGLVYFRKGRHPEAEEWIKKALAIAPDNPDIRLLLANVYEMANRENEALQELEQTLKNSSAHARTRYNLAELYLKSNQDKAPQRAEAHLNKLSQLAPANIVVRLQLIETLLGNGKAGEEAVRPLEELRQQMPELPAEAAEFYDVTKMAGVGDTDFGHAARFVDLDHEGDLDLFLTNAETNRVCRNNGDGTFEKDTRSQDLSNALRSVIGLDAAFGGFDHDGFLDLFIAGKEVLLFHNDGTGKFQDATSLLPEIPFSGRRIALADYDDDGDMDIFVAGLDGGVRLLRNDGGNVNHYLKVQLVGIRTGSGKNSYFGIGAKLEIRAGDLYQMRVVTAPISHFGLGQHLEADVVRIQWPNGVPQNSFHTASDQQIVEKQILKGSCPFLYTWDGEKYTFVTDIFWRSAIGMPLGIMAGATTYAFSNSTQEYLKIPGNLLKAKDGVYSLQITEEPWETPYSEEVKLIAIDHPDTVDIYIDEKFVGPPYPPLQIHTVAEKHLPVSAADERGNDLLLSISRKDDLHIANLRSTKYQGITEMHDLIST